jgi:hypothetical protein
VFAPPPLRRALAVAVTVAAAHATRFGGCAGAHAVIASRSAHVRAQAHKAVRRRACASAAGELVRLRGGEMGTVAWIGKREVASREQRGERHNRYLSPEGGVAVASSLSLVFGGSGGVVEPLVT